MSSKFRKFLRQSSSLLAVMGFLAALSIITSPHYFWAIYPILGMGIPVFIIFMNTMLGENKDAQASAARGLNAQTVANAEAAAAPIALDRSLAAQLEQVKTYRKALDELTRNASGARKDSLARLSAQFAEWQKSVEQTAQKISVYRANPVIQQDLRAVPESIKKLEGELVTEKNDNVRAQLSKTLATRKSQLASLEKLQSAVREAEIQLESTVSSLGTIYSQALAGQSATAIADYAHLGQDVDEQVRVLDDQLQSIEEVRLGRASANISN